MTREEHIAWLKAIRDSISGGDEEFDNKRRKSLDAGISALLQEPCDDAISRQAVKEIICAEFVDTQDGMSEWRNAVNDVVENILHKAEQLPSVTQKSGKWIRWREEVQRGTHYTENVPHCKCSECDKEYDIFASRFINYCPNCGCRMVEPQESEE